MHSSSTSLHILLAHDAPFHDLSHLCLVVADPRIVARTRPLTFEAIVRRD